MNNIILITTLYNTESPERAEEFGKCLNINSENRHIDKVIVFFETKDKPDFKKYPALYHKKAEIKIIRNRPTFKIFFDYANKYLIGDYIIISNADIYFDNDSNIELARKVKENHLWTICRYNPESDGTWQLQGCGVIGSYDVWIFHSPIKDFENDFSVGAIGCDSYLSQKAVEASVFVSNPALSVIAKHEDKSERKNRNSYLDSEKHSYWNMPDYMKYSVSLYCASPSHIEDNRFLSNQSLRYNIKHRILEWLHLK